MRSTSRTWPFFVATLASLALVICEPAKAGGDELARPYETKTTSSGWQVRWEPYGWLIGFKGNVTARSRTSEVDATFFDIVEESDSLFALMSYTEARKGRRSRSISMRSTQTWPSRRTRSVTSQAPSASSRSRSTRPLAQLIVSRLLRPAVLMNSRAFPWLRAPTALILSIRYLRWRALLVSRCRS